LHTVKKKESSVVSKKHEIQEKAKELLAKNKRTYTVGELQLLVLCWKLHEGYAEHNKKKGAELKALWEVPQNDDLPDLALPPPLQEPSIPTIDETELG
jgi:hypothetical protein